MISEQGVSIKIDDDIEDVEEISQHICGNYIVDGLNYATIYL